MNSQFSIYNELTMNTKEILLKAQKEGYAIGAFNAANIETLKAITLAAKKLNSPIIIEASKGEVDYIGKTQLVDLIKDYRNELNIPIILNLDHSESFEECEEAVNAGFDYIHFDGSKLPYDENLKIAKEIVKMCHAKGIIVEGEMDHIQGSSADHTKEKPDEVLDKTLYTDPKKAKIFVDETGIDTFAAFFGNLHGLYSTEKRLKLDVLEEIRNLLPNTFLSLHGGSGIDNKDIMTAIKIGKIVKININSEMRVAFKNALKRSLNETSEVAIYKITPGAIEEVQKIVEGKIKLFGSENRAS
ncbi:hypothetical protein A3H26_01650 [candidate division WWE3 bacterium RIFCSPLOWO2_12_FULL_36_10]|uniref:Tagatose-bisphosphate aldolase n=1 Tax=candidate division WWE3 bacterium RIFCSPLOWO2_12_FULL_36_10 TaxID=1802630 RepID=A0A1F4VI81_UNCKA|nr:MAG: hypothetical protein A3H26_01650 [candidate division WWE3 bacterium RIFCSPLOWO2_12_FULL_36_10]